MPTSRPRHVVTETDAVASALDRAAERWPEDRGSRKTLLLRLIAEGDRTIGAENSAARQARVARRQRIVRATSGRLSGVYGPGYLDELRDDWPV